MIDIKQAKDYFFYIIENSKYKITYICKDKQNIEIESENGISYFVSLDRTTSKWDYFNLYIKADRRSANLFRGFDHPTHNIYSSRERPAPRQG